MGHKATSIFLIFCIISLFVVTTPLMAFADTLTAVQSGFWNDPDTWGGVIPENSDDKVISDGIKVTINDLVTNTGIITISNSDDTGLVVSSTGTLSNNHYVLIQNTGGTGIINSGTISSPGFIGVQNTGGIGLENFATVDMLSSNMTISNTADTGVLNSGTISVDSSLWVWNDGGIGLENSGNIQNNLFLVLRNSFGIGILNIGSLINSGITEVENSAQIGITNEGMLTNPGTIDVSSTDGTGIYNKHGTISSSGTITIQNSGNSSDDRGIYNFGSLENWGSVTVTNPNVTGIYNIDIIHNHDTINNSGTIDNFGSILMYCDSTYIGNLPIGNPTTDFCDTTPPTITIIGNNPETVPQGTDYIDSGATALDDFDGDLTSKIIVDNTVDTSALGEYTVTYTVSDSAGNTAKTERKVIVKSVSDSLLDLIDTVEELVLPKGTYTSLTGNLDSAISLLSDGNESNDFAACVILESFVNKVDTQSGKKIDASDADSLISSTNQLIVALGC